MKNPWRSGPLASFLVALMLICGCGREARPLNVLIIGVDTLRPDHLGCYGYDRKQGVLFENVISQAPWTLPSFATVFTSLYPTQHGAVLKDSRLSTHFPTLAMMLLKNGYSTGAIINAPFLRPEYKVDRGFEHYNYAPPFADRVADGTTDDALSWIDRHIDEPFLMFVHYFDPHLPYKPPAPYDTLFYPDYAGELPSTFSLDLIPDARETDFAVMGELPPEDWDYIKALYDGEIAFTDAEVGRLLRELDARGLKENTLVIFLSDHGEEFYEHKGYEHGHALYNEVIKVPLIVSLPGKIRENATVTEYVRLLDITPTVLDILGIETSVHLEGASLMPLISGEGTPTTPDGVLLPAGIGYSEAMLYGPERKSLTAYPWKYINQTVAGDPKFFNLESDPGELNNLAHSDVEAMKPVIDLITETVFSVSESWYVEISGGGEEHVFDLEIISKRRRAFGRNPSFYIARVFDSEGHMLDVSEVPGLHVTETRIGLKGLKVSSKVMLAFKLMPETAGLLLDFRMDGVLVADKTFCGEELLNPESMPFSTMGENRALVRRGVPERRPDGPYLLVWRAGKDAEDGTSFEIDEDIENELRAVGYLQ